MRSKSISRSARLYMAAGFLALASPMSATAQVVYNGLVTADNAYRFAVGSEFAISAIDFQPIVQNTTIDEIVGPMGAEAYTGIDSGAFTYAYIATWGDTTTTQGVRAAFQDGIIPQFGAAAWEVFATGDNFGSPFTALTEANINAAITTANSPGPGAGVSLGWVNGDCDTPGRVGCVAEDVIGVGAEFLLPAIIAAGGGPTFFDVIEGVMNEPSSGWLWYNNQVPGNSNPFQYSAAGDSGWLLFRARLPLPNPLCSDQGASGLWNTGTDGTGQVLADQAIDPTYTLLSSPPGAPSGNSFKSQGNPGAWLTNDAVTTSGSAWIGPRPVSQSEFSGNYTYRMTINVPTALSTNQIHYGRWLSDDAGVDILVNGVSTGQTRPVNFTEWDEFSILPSDLVVGSNTIDFVVDNDQSRQGLRVEWCLAPPEIIAAGPPVPGLQPFAFWIATGLVMFLVITTRLGNIRKNQQEV